MLEVAMRRASVGAAIRRAREEKRWKQKDLAVAVHVEPQTISNWERSVSRPDLDMIEEVARATGKPLSYFVASEAEAADEQDRLRQIVHEEIEGVLAAVARIERLLRADQPREPPGPA